MMTLCALLSSSSAGAQSVGLQAGVSAEPNQFYFGGHLETPPLVDALHFRPNVEVGLGDSVTVVAINVEFVYRFPSRRPWSLYGGGGPALNIISERRDTHPEGGFTVVVGAAHRSGLFVEIKGGAMDSPNFKAGVGYTFR